jgi:outer membrane protein assembly factor BamB
MRNEPLSSVSERQRVASPAVTPQALAWRDDALWVGSRDLHRIYGINPDTWKVFTEAEAPGIPWAAASAGEALCFTIGEGENDDRYLRRYSIDGGFFDSDRVACPEFSGSYLSYDGQHVYLSQWYKHRVLKLDASGNILRTYDVGAEICGHTIVNGAIYVLRGTEQGNEDWTLSRLDLQASAAPIYDLAKVPFQCRSLAFDGTYFWTNHRVANEIVRFALPD